MSASGYWNIRWRQKFVITIFLRRATLILYTSQCRMDLHCVGLRWLTRLWRLYIGLTADPGSCVMTSLYRTGGGSRFEFWVLNTHRLAQGLCLYRLIFINPCSVFWHFFFICRQIFFSNFIGIWKFISCRLNNLQIYLLHTVWEYRYWIN